MKIFILFALLTSSLFAEGEAYMGVFGGVATEQYSNVQASSSSAITMFKIGYGDRKAYAVEFSLDYTKNSSKIFSSEDGDKIRFNVSLLKAFDWDIYILPFARVGFGAGYMQIDRALQSALSYGSFNGALGSFIPLGEDFDIELAYEIRHNSYEPIDDILTKTNYKSNFHTIYLGINYRY